MRLNAGPAWGFPQRSAATRPAALLLAVAALVSACATPAGGGFAGRELAHRESQVRRGLAGARDAQAERDLQTLACRLLPGRCNVLRVYVVDRASPQARAYANGMLLVHGALFGHLDDAAELAFALGHELAHLALGHFDDQRTLALELAADAWATRRLVELGYRGDAGITLLQRFAATEHLRAEVARQRLEALRGLE